MNRQFMSNCRITTFFILGFLFFASIPIFAQQHSTFKGKVFNSEGEPLMGATIFIQQLGLGDDADSNGVFEIKHIPEGTYKVVVSYLGFEPIEEEVAFRSGETKDVNFRLAPDKNVLSEIEVFGARRERPEKLEALTRIPLRLDEQVQSISVISHKMITDQGALTLNDAVRNAPGLTTFATYGNTSESLTSRGYRGIPVVKNGVRVQSDFRGTGFLSDMQGVETIQVLRGSAAIAQGVGNDLGSAGGVVNIATKTPQFVNMGNVGIRTGSWGQFRPTFDLQHVLNSTGTAAFRINGAYERSDSYRAHVSKDRIYVNPSFAWRPDDKTKIVLEMDYMHDSRTPDQGTVNLSADSVNNIYKMPHDNFMGFASDRQISNILTYMAHATRELGNGYSFRIAYAGSNLDLKSVKAHVSQLKNVASTGKYNLRSRAYSGSQRDDKNGVLQIDFRGIDIYTGSIKHTFNAGFDYRWFNVETTSTNSMVVDTIDVLQKISNIAPKVKLVDGTPSNAREYTYGLSFQEVITFNKYLKASLGLRYSQYSGVSNNAITTNGGDVWDPLFGVIITPFKDFNIFASYTTTTSLRNASRLLLEDKESTVGPEREKQFEVGFKSEWFDNRFRFNATYFNIRNNNLSYEALDEGGNSTSLYIKAGNLKRQGVELDITGRLLRNLDLVLGYAYLDAGYHDSPYYHEGSAPMNTTDHTANAWLNYTVIGGPLRNLAFGAGAYYVGKRPLAEYTYRVVPGHDVQPNTRPFLADDYLTVNAHISYRYQNYTLRAFVNNIFDSTGHTAYYRGGYLNPTDPTNFAVSLNYSF